MKKYLFIVLLVGACFGQTSISELVNVKDIIPSIKLDIKYATTDNFTEQKLYTTDECYLLLGALNQLKIVQDSLRNIYTHNGESYPQGLGLKIWDGYRPRSVQYLMWEIFPDPQYVANPATGSSHNRGGAVDVTLIDLRQKKSWNCQQVLIILVKKHGILIQTWLPTLYLIANY